jgi:hypothetical protein
MISLSCWARYFLLFFSVAIFFLSAQHLMPRICLIWVRFICFLQHSIISRETENQFLLTCLPYNAGNFLASCGSVSHEVLCSMDLVSYLKLR